MAVSLKKYKPVASELNILSNTSLDGKSNRTKSSSSEQPARARKSAHQFASLKVWLTLKRWNCLRRNLQSFRIGEYDLLDIELSDTSLATVRVWSSFVNSSNLKLFFFFFFLKRSSNLNWELRNSEILAEPFPVSFQIITTVLQVRSASIFLKKFLIK